MNSGAIYASTNSGVTWTATIAPIEGWLAIACSADCTRVVAAPEDNNLFTSSNSGRTWQRTSTPAENWGVIASSADGTRLMATAYGDQQNADLGTANWTDVPTVPTARLNNLHSQVVISPLTDKRFYRLKTP